MAPLLKAYDSHACVEKKKRLSPHDSCSGWFSVKIAAGTKEGMTHLPGAALSCVLISSRAACNWKKCVTFMKIRWTLPVNCFKHSESFTRWGGLCRLSVSMPHSPSSKSRAWPLLLFSRKDVEEPRWASFLPSCRCMKGDSSYFTYHIFPELSDGGNLILSAWYFLCNDMKGGSHEKWLSCEPICSLKICLITHIKTCWDTRGAAHRLLTFLRR